MQDHPLEAMRDADAAPQPSAQPAGFGFLLIPVLGTLAGELEQFASEAAQRKREKESRPDLSDIPFGRLQAACRKTRLVE